MRLRSEESEYQLKKINVETKSWKFLRFYDTVDFDPILYLSRKTIMCKKYNYAVPESFGSSTAIVKYSWESDKLDIYKVDHLLNNSVKDDGKYIFHGGKRLFKLDKLIQSIRMQDIKGFIYGPFSTRFWMMRMGINQLIVDNCIKTKKLDKKEKDKQKNKSHKSRYEK